jgi:hypothetical protein
MDKVVRLVVKRHQVFFQYMGYWYNEGAFALLYPEAYTEFNKGALEVVHA